MSGYSPPPLVRFSKEPRSDPPDYWGPSAESDVPEKQLLEKPAPTTRGSKAARIRRPTVIILIITVLMVILVVAGIVFWWKKVKGSDDSGILVNVRNGAVSSELEVCSRVGVGILKMGGNSVDAIIATAICVGAINSFATGIGGGGFLVARTIYGESKAFNFREMAPGAASRDMYGNDTDGSLLGGLSVAIPGEVDGFATAHALLGKLAWHELWAPSIELCRGGFVVTERLALMIRVDTEFFNRNRDTWGFLFSEETGELLTAGQMMRREAFADTLEIIAAPEEAREGGDTYKGVREFYNGTIAAKLARFVQKNGGILTEEDFSKYFTVVEETSKAVIDDLQILTCPPPCSGLAMITGLNIAEGLDMRDPEEPVSHHYLVEAMKWLSAARTELGDPADPVAANNSQRIHEITSKEWAAAVRANISSTHTYPWEHYRPAFEPTEPKGTTHMSVFDRRGGAAALTSTVNADWGSKLHDPATGIVLNNEMDDFSLPGRPNAYGLEPSIFNYILPYKRPLSSMAPTIVIEGDGSVGLVVGASGGSRIVTGVFEAVVRTYFWGWGLLDTIKRPRVHHQLFPQNVSVEHDTEPWVVKALRDRGHQVEVMEDTPTTYRSVLQAVRGVGARVEGVADYWRKGGMAAGY